MKKYTMIIRKNLRNIYLNIIGKFCKPSSHIHILNGHMIHFEHDNIEDGEYFAQLLSELNKTCEFINIEEAVNKIINHEKVSKPTIAFTFDDGFSDCYTQIAPQLEKYGVNAMFFINPNFISATENNNVKYIKNFVTNVTKSPYKRPMTWEQIIELKKRGFLFGAHTIDHYCINDDNTLELEHQIGDCRKIIEDKLGEECEYFAFPYGQMKHANYKSIEIACKHYKYVFSQDNHKYYFSFNGKVINRRHFEPFWPISHINYFINVKRK